MLTALRLRDFVIVEAIETELLGDGRKRVFVPLTLIDDIALEFNDLFAFDFNDLFVRHD